MAVICERERDPCSHSQAGCHFFSVTHTHRLACSSELSVCKVRAQVVPVLCGAVRVCVCVSFCDLARCLFPPTLEICKHIWLPRLVIRSPAIFWTRTCTFASFPSLRHAPPSFRFSPSLLSISWLPDLFLLARLGHIVRFCLFVASRTPLARAGFSIPARAIDSVGAIRR